MGVRRFGNMCDVTMRDSEISDAVTAFSLRTYWDRGTKCCRRASPSRPPSHTRIHADARTGAHEPI